MLLWWLTLLLSLKLLVNLLIYLLLLLDSGQVQVTTTTTEGAGGQEWWRGDQEGFFGDVEEEEGAARSSWIPGVYRMENSTNMEEYLREAGVPYLLRKLSPMAVPVCTIGRHCQQVKKKKRKFPTGLLLVCSFCFLNKIQSVTLTRGSLMTRSALHVSKQNLLL